MYVEDVKDGKRTYRHIFYHTFLNMVLFECNAIYVKDVEDRSNTPKGCNAMYVKDGKRTYRHIFYHTFLNMVSFECNAIYVKDVEDRSNTP